MFAIPDPEYETPQKGASQRRQVQSTSKQVQQVEISKHRRDSLSRSSTNSFEDERKISATEGYSRKPQSEARFEIKDLQFEISRYRCELVDLRQERAELLARQLEHDLALTSLHGQRLEEQRKILSLQKAHDESIGSTILAAKARRELLEAHISKQTRWFRILLQKSATPHLSTCAHAMRGELTPTYFQHALRQ
jgi:hypothetical protein